MSLTSNTNKNNKKGGKNAKPSALATKFQVKPGKAAGFSKKPVKTGGTRGS